MQQEVVGRYVTGIHHVGIAVTDFEGALGFYHDPFGLDVIGISDEKEVWHVVGVSGARARFTDVDAGIGQMLKLLEYRTAIVGARLANTVGTCHLSLQVADTGADLAVLARGRDDDAPRRYRHAVGRSLGGLHHRLPPRSRRFDRRAHRATCRCLNHVGVDVGL